MPRKLDPAPAEDGGSQFVAVELCTSLRAAAVIGELPANPSSLVFDVWGLFSAVPEPTGVWRAGRGPFIP